MNSNISSKNVMSQQDRRSQTFTGRLQREAWDFFMESDLCTLARVLCVFQLALAVGIAYIPMLVISYPPLWHEKMFTPPSTFWVIFLLSGVYLQSQGAKKNRTCIGKEGAIASFFFLLGTVGPLFSRTPILAGITFLAAMGQGIVVARVWHKCRKSKVP